MSRSRDLLAVAGGVMLAAAVVSVVVVPLVWDLPTAANLGQLAGVVLGVPAVAVGLWRWWRVAPVAVGTAQVYAGADVLARAVFVQWIEEARIRSLGDPNPMPVRWRLTSRPVMDHPEVITSGALSFTGTGDQARGLAEQFRGLERRRLVILGGPGAGKTTLAVQLVLRLSDPDTRRPDEPVPVLFPVAGWDTTVFPRLQDWLADRLAEDYPALRATTLGPDTARNLVSNGQVLPVLDGLDELPDTARVAVVRAINASLAEGDGLILTSRTSEYGDTVTTAGRVLRSATVIEPDPIIPSDTAAYLRRCLSPNHGQVWAQILTTLATGMPSPLTDALATPLNVWLLREVYINNHRDPAPLLDRHRFPDSPAIRFHLLDQLIPAVLATRPASPHSGGPFRPRHRWKPDDVHRWLGYLAQYLTQHNTRDFAWWHLARNTLHSTSRLAVGLTVGFIGGITVGFESGLAMGLAGGLVVGLATGLAGGIVGWGVVPLWVNDEPGYANLQLHRPKPSPAEAKTTTLLTRLLVVGLATGLVGGLVGGLADGLGAGLLGLVLGCTIKLVKWAERPALTSTASTPGSVWRADRALTLLRTPTVGLVIGIAAGIAGGPALGLWAGLLCGLLSALLSAKHHAWVVFELAALRLAHTRQLPRRLMAFLDDTHRLGLLRVVGPVYQFRHADLHDHLAATHTTNQTPALLPGSTEPVG